MKLIYSAYFRLGLLLLSAFLESNATQWHRGIVQLEAVEPGVYFQGYSGEKKALDNLELPHFFTGLGEFISESNSRVEIKISTGIFASWEGPGLFAIDQFEHKWIWGTENESTELMMTRSIFHIDDGILFLDASSLTEGSVLVIENPLGKLISRDGIFLIQVEDFQGNDKKQCLVNCYGGTIEMQDVAGNSYEIGEGAKLTLMFQDNLTKVDNSLMTELDLSTFDDFKDRWAESQPQDFPALKNPRGKKPVADSSNLIEPELLQEDYFIPLMRPIKTFRPYKAPADLGKAYLGLD